MCTPPVVLDNVQDQLLALLREEYQNSQTISDNLLSSLNFVFGNPLLPALDLVDNLTVTKFSSPSGREAYQVLIEDLCGTRAHLALILAANMRSSHDQVLKRKEAPMCKHALAVLISSAMGTCKVATLTDENMAHLILTNTDVDNT